MAAQTPTNTAPFEDRMRNLIIGNAPPAISDVQSHSRRPNQRARRNQDLNQSNYTNQNPSLGNQVPYSSNTQSQQHQAPSSQGPSFHGANGYQNRGAPQAQNWRTPSMLNDNFQQRTPQTAMPNGQQKPMYVAQRGPQTPMFMNNQARQPGTDNRQRARPPQSAPPSHYQQTVDVAAQLDFLERTITEWLPSTMMSAAESSAKDAFRVELERLCQQAVRGTFPELANLQLASFGSLSSGFGMPGSDMDLALVSPVPLSAELPRLLEKAILDQNYGARLLTRTRVPIIKVCENPLPELWAALLQEREKWDVMTPEERAEFDSPIPKDEQPTEKKKKGTEHADVQHENDNTNTDTNLHKGSGKINGDQTENAALNSAFTEPPNKGDAPGGNNLPVKSPHQHREQRPWYREKKLGPLDFPKSGVGIQCDINFSNPLGLHNTKLLRCYSLCDPRVRPMVLFVKAWASRRKINSSYSGTLSSYGYVLMVLHYLVNVTSPPVCPNLQLVRRPHDLGPRSTSDPNLICDGRDVYFWRSETEIQNLASRSLLTTNRESLSALLKGFFAYYAQQGYQSPFGGFSWQQEVLSLRTPGGLLTKEAKQWTGARTTTHDKKEVRHRYLFAIEDPFERDHNVARTVTHNGIVAIRDEFRRAWRIIQAVGRGARPEGELFEVSTSQEPDAVGGSREATTRVPAVDVIAAQTT